MNKKTIDFIEKCNNIISITRSPIGKLNKLKIKRGGSQMVKATILIEPSPDQT